MKATPNSEKLTDNELICICTDIKALPEQKVSVLNYRKKPARWEDGVCKFTDIKVDHNGKTRTSYSVWVLSEGQRGGYYVTVGNNAINQQKP